MSAVFYTIDDEIFKDFPGYTRGVILAFGLKNSESPPELIALLREAESFVRERIKQEEIATHPRISSWREAYRSFGAKPTKFRSSTEAMIRRVVNNNELPSINALVDIGNTVSLRHIVSVGSHAIDDVKQDIALRKATGEEEFIPFGTEQIEHPNPGEIIFTEGNTVLTRRWTWRQANYTMTELSTTAIEFNIDGLPPVTKSDIEDIGRETMDLIKKFCGGSLRFEYLSQENPKIELVE